MRGCALVASEQCFVGSASFGSCLTLKKVDSSLFESTFFSVRHWETILKSLVRPSSRDFQRGSICTEHLKVGIEIRIKWAPDRTSTLRYLGNGQFEIIDSKNASWQVGDTFFCHHLILDKPLYVDNLKDSQGNLKSALYVVGELGGIRW